MQLLRISMVKEDIMSDTQKKHIDDRFVLVGYEWFGNGGLIQKYGSNAYLSLHLFILLQQHLSFRGYSIINLDYIYKYFGITNTNYNYKKKIMQIIKNLIDDKYIVINEDIKEIKSSTLLFLKLVLPEDHYVVVYDDEISKIINYKGKENISKLLTLFIFIKKCVNINSGLAYPGEEGIMSNIFLGSNKTIENDKKILWQIGLILYANPGLRMFSNGSMCQSNDIIVLNIEGAEERLNQAIEKYKQEMEEKSIHIYKAKKANENRSKKMKEYHANLRCNVKPPDSSSDRCESDEDNNDIDLF